MKKITLFCVFLIASLLCSFSNGASTPDGYNSTETDSADSYINSEDVTIEVGKQYIYDLGHRTGPMITQDLRWTVLSYKQYNAAHNGFILNYDQKMVNPKAIIGQTLTLTNSISSEYSFSYESSETNEISGKLGCAFSLGGANLSVSLSAAHITTTTYGFSYSYGTINSNQNAYEFDYSTVPSGYLVSPCIVCNAVEMEYSYTIYDHWWWGDYPSRTASEVNVLNKVLVYDSSSFEMTICIREEGFSGKPIYYLHA